MKGQFEKYVNLVQKSAHFYSKKWGIDYEEVEAQAYLLYCESVDTFDFKKSGFSTYLTWQLKRLNDFCKTYRRQQGVLIEDWFKPSNMEDEESSIYELIPARSNNMSLAELLEIGLHSLSKEAYSMFKWILNRTWETKGKLKPSISLAMRTFNYSRIQAETIWNEIGNLYNTTLYAL